MLAAVSPLFLAVFFFAVFMAYGGWALFRPPRAVGASTRIQELTERGVTVS